MSFELKKIEVSYEVYKKLEALASGFDTPCDVIERLLNDYKVENSKPMGVAISKSTQRLLPPEVVFIPSKHAFRQQLLEHKCAYIKLYYANGISDIKEWRALRFTENSHLGNNLNSGYLRGWKDKGIRKAILAIDRDAINEIAKQTTPPIYTQAESKNITRDEMPGYDYMQSLRSTGAGTFVKYFEEYYKVQEWSIDKLKGLFRKKERWNDSSISIKASAGRSIITHDAGLDALKYVAQSTRLDGEIIRKAKEIIEELES